MWKIEWESFFSQLLVWAQTPYFYPLFFIIDFSYNLQSYSLPTFGLTTWEQSDRSSILFVLESAHAYTHSFWHHMHKFFQCRTTKMYTVVILLMLLKICNGSFWVHVVHRLQWIIFGFRTCYLYTFSTCPGQQWHKSFSSFQIVLIWTETCLNT